MDEKSENDKLLDFNFTACAWLISLFSDSWIGIFKGYEIRPKNTQHSVVAH